MKKHILICDDDQEILDVVVQTLQLNPKYKVTPLEKGQEVLQYLETADELPDLLILDLWLPDVEGDDITTMIRRKQKTQDIPVILMSAVIVNIEIIAQKVGAQAHLSKPFLLEELEEKVERLIGQDEETM